MDNNRSHPKRYFALAALVLFTLIAAACGGDDDDSATTKDKDEATASEPAPDQQPAAQPKTSGEQLTGDFLVSGSSTVFPMVLRQAEQFAGLEPGVAIAVEGPGSGDGAKKFCAGDVPIANTSRLLKDEEIAVCEEAGIDYIELRRGIDGISMITSPENAAIDCVSFNDL